MNKNLSPTSRTYAQKTGELQQDSTHVATGYSGSGSGNNPAMQNVADVGPIPAGDWTIAGHPPTPPVMVHTFCNFSRTPKPRPSAAADSSCMATPKRHPGSASEGCVILPRDAREQVWNSGDRDLEMVAEIKSPAPQKKEVK